MREYEARFYMLAAEFMAWDDDEWTGNALDLVCNTLLGSDDVAIAERLGEHYRTFIYGKDRYEIVNEDMVDRFVDDDEYERFLDWAQAL